MKINRTKKNIKRQEDKRRKYVERRKDNIWRKKLRKLKKNSKPKKSGHFIWNTRHRQCTYINNEEGKTLSKIAKIFERWKNYYCSLLNNREQDQDRTEYLEQDLNTT